MRHGARRPGFWPLAVVFGGFVLFLYGPVITIFVLSFQGPDGGLTFPMQGMSTHWYGELWKGLGVVDIGAARRPGCRRHPSPPCSSSSSSPRCCWWAR